MLFSSPVLILISRYQNHLLDFGCVWMHLWTLILPSLVQHRHLIWCSGNNQAHAWIVGRISYWKVFGCTTIGMRNWYVGEVMCARVPISIIHHRINKQKRILVGLMNHWTLIYVEKVTPSSPCFSFSIVVPYTNWSLCSDCSFISTGTLGLTLYIYIYIID